MTGAGTSATRPRCPDVGLLTMTKIVDNATRIDDAFDIRPTADADNRFGRSLNVRRTIQLPERGGVAAVHLEDQGAAQALRPLVGQAVDQR